MLKLRTLVAATTLSCGYLVCCPTLAQDNAASSIKIIDTIPDPRALADILFAGEVADKPLTRSIVLTQKKQPATNSAIAMHINFKFGKAVILQSSLPYLDAVGEMLNLADMKDKRLLLEGHTDSIGARMYNQSLSEKRALAVRRYLVSRHGIDASRLQPIGKGEAEPLDSTNTKAAINRRVQFKSL